MVVNHNFNLRKIDHTIFITMGEVRMEDARKDEPALWWRFLIGLNVDWETVEGKIWRWKVPITFIYRKIRPNIVNLVDLVTVVRPK